MLCLAASPVHTGRVLYLIRMVFGALTWCAVHSPFNAFDNMLRSSSLARKLSRETPLSLSYSASASSSLNPGLTRPDQASDAVSRKYARPLHSFQSALCSAAVHCAASCSDAGLDDCDWLRASAACSWHHMLRSFHLERSRDIFQGADCERLEGISELWSSLGCHIVRDNLPICSHAVTIWFKMRCPFLMSSNTCTSKCEPTHTALDQLR
ncbi:MAG: hypothetical protein J3Q66DRAFT_4929 [Benniella sp.]|nr:MAG: hypothetical protein J3Q66DRAFT_4929 [Benniella sp.]